jgi:hypothetical protein
MVPFPLLVAFLCEARFSQEVEVQSSVTVYSLVGQVGRSPTIGEGLVWIGSLARGVRLDAQAKSYE